MRRALTALLLASLAVLFAAPTAGAAAPNEIVSGTDPRGDAVAGRGDIRQWDIAYLSGTSQYRARIHLHRGDTALNWLQGDNELRIYWDTDFVSPGAEYMTRFEPGFDQSETNIVFTASTFAVGSQLSNPGCRSYDVATNTTAAYVEPNLYRVRFAESCLGSPQEVRARIEMHWDTPPAGGNIGIDRAPNSGWTRKF